MTIVVGLTGYKRCGKDTSASVLIEQFGFRKYAFADALREIAYATDPMISMDAAPGWMGEHLPSEHHRYSQIIDTLGYERAKEIPDFRRFLQRLGTEGIRSVFGENAWVDALDRRIRRDGAEFVVVPDCRFRNEAEWVRKTGVLWRVIRPGHGGDDNHPSERDIPNLPVDNELVAESVEELQKKVWSAVVNSGLLDKSRFSRQDDAESRLFTDPYARRRAS